MTMKITKDVFHIDQAPGEAVHGAKPEPEERMVTRAMDTAATVTGNGDQQVKGQMAAQIRAEMTTEEAARIIGATCDRCKHFDNEKWVKMWNEAVTDPTQVEKCNEYRLAYLLSNDPEVRRRHGVADGDLSVEHAIKSMGFCHVFRRACTPLSMCLEGFIPAWEGKTPEIAKDTEMRRQTLLQSANFASKR